MALRTDEIDRGGDRERALPERRAGRDGLCGRDGDGGDLTSPDPFLLGGYHYYGRARAVIRRRDRPADRRVQGAAALNRWLYRFTSLPVLQAQLEAYEP